MAVTNFLEGTLPRNGAESMSWWNKYMVDQYARSPILRDYLKAHQDWFDPRLFGIMEQALAALAAPLRP